MEGFWWPGAPGPRLPNQLGSEHHFIIVGTCTISPITAEPYRAKEQSLHVRRSCFAPTKTHLKKWACGGGAGYRPRVRAAYYTVVYRHSRPGKPIRPFQYRLRQLILEELAESAPEPGSHAPISRPDGTGPHQ